MSAATSPDQIRTRTVAVDGCGGAGKATFAKRLARTLDNCPIVHSDDFASWDRPLDWHPRLVEQVFGTSAAKPCSSLSKVRLADQPTGAVGNVRTLFYYDLRRCELLKVRVSSLTQFFNLR